MTLILNSQNIFEYLIKNQLCRPSEQEQSHLKPIDAKNFNLLVTFPDNRQLLVKQERHNPEGKAAGEFLSEWQVQNLLQTFPELEHLRQSISEVLHFDATNSILVFRYLNEYQDLNQFYVQENNFPREIAIAIATFLATLHRQTNNHQKYQDFLAKKLNNSSTEQATKLIQGLGRIGPEIFGMVPTDGLKFFALYQRYDSLGQAIEELGGAFNPTCLTHNDLKLNNILLHQHWQLSETRTIRLIDWERSSWGDPAFDLGTLIGSYLQIWLSSLIISQSLTIEESIRLANTPLEFLQPSMAALINAYVNTFPEILEHRPDFLQRAVQFAGFFLIQQIQAMIQYQKSFGNTGIAMLQVAKTLLCRPTQSMPTIFGANAIALT